MLNVLACIASEHRPAYTFAALAVCVVGSLISMHLFARARRTSGMLKFLWLVLTGIIAGGSIWSTHFVSMMGYVTPVKLGFALVPTIYSLAIAMVVSGVGFAVGASTLRTPLVEVGGAILGLGVVVMHYVGISAMEMNGWVVWETRYVVSSVVFALLFGALATNRIARPITAVSKYFAAAAMVLAIVFTHFTAMTGMSIEPAPAIVTGQVRLSEPTLTIGILGVMSTLFLLAIAAYLIDTRTSRDASRKIEHLSLYDPLTGLSNRTNSVAHLGAVISGREDYTARVVVVMIGIDRFREITDAQGQRASDMLLIGLAERLAGSFGGGLSGERDFFGYFGGDTFFGLRYPVYGLRGVSAFAREIAASFDAPVEIDSGRIEVRAHMGAAVFPDHGTEPSQLIEYARLALQRARATASAGVVVYDPALDQKSREAAALSIDLRHAIDRDQLVIYYQPQNDSRTGEIVGFEVLLRWEHPERGQVQPAEFIPIAEETGLIVSIGEWVLRKACCEASKWEKPVRIAVNVAPLQLDRSDLPSIVRGALADSGLPPERLELEITESGIISDQARALHLIRAIGDIGVTVAMDDYGTGYSSLSTLQTIPFDKIKVDREFIKDILTNDQSAAIVKATLILAQSLDIPVLAEGVETGAQLEFLNDLGCVLVQGFLFGKPMTSAELGETGWISDPPRPVRAVETGYRSAVA